ncbi:stage III sporulation AC/AD family protein [Kineothrix sp. MB12-C1]|uniref:stage III sporulation AC/AD family protein n=1 Tax=Kineothrix sp. MB12-C1 TaxID=3070215 RepID=UPI0027D2E00B|nr:stage III sporulation AC/AD family protein [Kineothrix sp. MB12-C1]WMC92947.1 stage III sporulation AC/AD family protein [Kineothrix sp. MB12-C1]
MDVFKISLLGITGVMIALQFKSGKQEYGLYIGFAVCLIIFSYAISGLGSFLNGMGELKQYLNSDNAYFRILLKVIGITYICEFCAGICKDAGYSSIAGQVEIFGKLSVLIAGMPVLLAIIQSIQEISG